jgi:dihydrofolate synthase/folylpolyglutamate synthase
MSRSLADWLRWQESLNPRDIDLGLGRIQEVAARLPIRPPAGAVFAVAGTNGKGSTVAFLEALLLSGGYRTGVYTSPHLVRYNERVRIAGSAVRDAQLIPAFEQIEAARGGVPLTFFEFGTLAAWLIMTAESCDAWVLEVGLGGRLDAVNAIDPDFSLITTIAFDHQDWLGDTLEQIAAEKAGIMRAGRPAFYGDHAPPDAILARAAELDSPLRLYGRDYATTTAATVDGSTTWAWHGEQVSLNDLPGEVVADDAQRRNAGLALAAVEQFDASLLSRAAVGQCLSGALPAGRFQVVARTPAWVLDVAHNEQAARVLRARLEGLGESGPTTVVIGMLADKQIEAFVAVLNDAADRWIVATVDDPRAAEGAVLLQRIMSITDAPAMLADSLPEAFQRAEAQTPRDGLILCCGSFHIVGPAIEWLGLYS